MKKLILIFILFLFICNGLFGLDDVENNFVFDISLCINAFNFNENILLILESEDIVDTFFSLSIGWGYNFNIISNILTPGIYFDFGFIFYESNNLLSNNPADNDRRLNIMGGVYLYNIFRYRQFEFQPFFGVAGYELLGLSSFCLTFGTLLTFRNFGIKYSYKIPFTNSDKIKNIHRFSLVYRFRFNIGDFFD